jgi:hypothetical protein
MGTVECHMFVLLAVVLRKSSSNGRFAMLMSVLTFVGA